MVLSGAGGAGHLDPLLYPWDPPVASGVMDGNEFRPLEPSAGLDEALAQAGAMFAAGTQPITIDDSVIVGNSATSTSLSGPAEVEGSGLLNGGLLQLDRVQVSNNAGSAKGGAFRPRSGESILCGSRPRLMAINATIGSATTIPPGSGSGRRPPTAREPRPPAAWAGGRTGRPGP